MSPTHTRQVVVTAGEGDRVLAQVDDDLLDDLLGQQSALLAHVVVGGGHDAGEAAQRRLTDCLALVLDRQLLCHDVPVQQRRQLAEVAAHVRYVVQRYAQLTAQSQTQLWTFLFRQSFPDIVL